MMSGLFHLVIIVAGIWAIFSGYKAGFMRQLGLLVGLTFAIVAARLLAPEIREWTDGWVPGSVSGFNRPFLVQTLAASIIFLGVFGVVALMAIPLGNFVKVLGRGILNSICGAVLRLFLILMVLSVLYNIIVDFYPAGSLSRSSRLHDGNVVESVIKIAPSMLDFPPGEEVSHRQQLEDAKKIS